MKLTIQNPHKLIDMYNQILPNWVVKFRSSGIFEGGKYVYGFQDDKSKVWDKYRVEIMETLKVMYDPNDMGNYQYVQLKIKAVDTQREICNTIRLEEFRNVERLMNHIIDGIYQTQIH
jgi:hypothetical protein